MAAIKHFTTILTAVSWGGARASDLRPTGGGGGGDARDRTYNLGYNLGCSLFGRQFSFNDQAIIRSLWLCIC